MDEADDPILVQRARVLRLTNLGQRVGYSLLLLALITFFVGLFVSFNTAVTTTIIVAMAVAAPILAASIIFSYAAKAAERFERTGQTGH